MLPAVYRLKRRRDFARAYNKGKAKSCGAFVLYRSCRVCSDLRRVKGGRGCGGAQSARIGFSASKKLGPAVTRNRIKRVFRHAAASQIKLFSPGCDYIFVIRRQALACDFGQIKTQMAKILSRF
ncbi:MAG: ribonuclease P protein component [Clostridia bacterium]|nr:ribonuclease P protein component [Clostridia bacterium]